MSPFRASQRDVKNHSLWMFMDAADSLFVVTIFEFLSLSFSLGVATFRLTFL